jgi:hypothetical protein
MSAKSGHAANAYQRSAYREFAKKPRPIKPGSLVLGTDDSILELVIHTDEDVLHIRLGAKGSTSSRVNADAGLKGVTKGAEAHEIIFKEHRPLRHEHPFGTDAGCPTGFAVGVSRENCPSATDKV